MDTGPDPSLSERLAPKYRFGVTLRAILIGLLLIPVNSYWIFTTEIIRYQGHPTTISLFYTSIFNLVLLIIANAVLRRFIPRWALSQGEMITVYVMLNIGGALAGHDALQVLVSLIPYPAYIASSANRWNELFLDKVPNWLIVKDPIAVKRFYMGGDFYDPASFGPWIMPVLWWSAFTIVLVGMFLCLNVLLRKQWTEHEKLSYPLVQLPLDMTAEGAPLFKEKLLWYGFAIAAAIDLVNGLSMFYPQIPQIPIKLGDQSMLFTARPWNNIGWLPIQLYPFGIGLGMLLPVDLLFSCWFFFWTWKAQRIMTAAFGLDFDACMPFVNEQSFGAYIGICAFSILIARRHFIALVRHFIGLKTDIDDRNEPIPYKLAMWLLLGGAMFLIAFSRAAGLSWWVILPFFLIFFAMSIAITRMRAELGPPAHDLHFAGPDTIIPSVFGAKTLGVQNLSILSLYSWFNRAYRAHTMPFQLEGFKMAERTGMSYRRLYVAIMIAAVVGTFVTFWVILHLFYKNGAEHLPGITFTFGMEPWNRMEGWVKSPGSSDASRMTAMAVGFAVTMVLNSLRMRLGWFPFHPVGYAVSSSNSMHLLWLSMFIAWVIKMSILRYGGLRLYLRALPFFLGIILGECVVGSLWTIVGIALNLPSYAFWP